MGNFAINTVNQETGEVTGVLNCEVRAFPIAEPRGNTKGYANISIEGLFGANGISIIEGKNGLFVSMPQTKVGRDYKDIFHPVTSEGRKALNDAVLSEFAVQLDAMVTQKESTVQKLRDAASAAKGQTAPGVGAKDKVKKVGGPEH